MRSKFAVWIICLVVLGFVLALLAPHLVSGSEGYPPVVESKEPSAKRDQQDSLPKAAIAPPADRSAIDEVPSINIVDREGHRLAGVLIETLEKRDSPPHRRLPASAFLTMGTTASNGSLVIAGPLKGGQIIRASKRGYAMVDHLCSTNTQHSVTITLDRSACISVTCKLRDGTALPNANILVSQHPIQARETLDTSDNLRPGDALEAVVTCAKSDAFGRSRVDDLLVGDYFVDARHPDCIVVGGPKGGKVHLQEGDNVLTLDFDPLYCAIARVSGASLLSWTCDYPDGLLLRPHLVNSIDLIMGAKTGGDVNMIALAGVPNFVDSRYAPVSPDALVKTFTMERGWADIKVPVHRFSVNTAPYVASIPATQEVPSSEICVLITDPDGRDVPCDDIQFIPFRGESVAPVRIKAKAGLTRVLPDGKYALATSQPFLRKALKGITVVVGKERNKVISLAVSVSPCRLSAAFANGLPIESGQITIACQKQTETMAIEYGLRNRTLLLPVGQASVRVIGATGGKVEATVDIAAGRENMLDLGVVK